VTLSLIIVDFVWRRFVMPFETLLIYAVLGEIVAAIILVGTGIYLRNRSRVRGST
jgi:predicted transporter